MKTIQTLTSFAFLLLYLIIAAPFQSCHPEEIEDDPDSLVVFKPNIYLYPQEQMELTVEVEFPMGGRIINSIPEYRNGWRIEVDSNGWINDAFRFLFYESIQPDVWQKNYGWVVKRSELETFFRENLSHFGFQSQELEDFISYWIPRFTAYDYYSIYPQTSGIIEQVIELHFSQQPDNALRLFYAILGQEEMPANLIHPSIDHFDRQGFFIAEWGVVKLNE